ncbi:hypothetical protein H6G26_37130 [Nostoc sp. FACHB-888]|nr:hypothetical protein [Nostoc sp. FACHB-888]
MPSPTTDLVRSYLKEIGRYPLLLSKRLQMLGLCSR